ncbi:phytoene dehydrogenase [Dehalococcoides mccartyi]|uniref:phytoene desaturase family protein n=1 Tax=Dehalococcoides mccartyi TaxID=61435 RepID=UPI00098E9D86|nr:NAD(P)/FAD-dependent oxidoreductase [Dehalococcoides mccartyi]AQU05830.1 phytoene dehydrogenase [Dehalococcoides mccartyi]AQU07275.1 phytoene dehydrogenase [Dehalococcoides mccartyi]
MSSKKVIIIGAGLAGLSAGCYSRMNGYATRIYEHHSKPGGVAACWRRGEYLIDGGIHFMMGSQNGTDLYNIYRQLGVADPANFVPMKSYGSFIDIEGSRQLDIPLNISELALDLKMLSPADAPLIEDLATAVTAFSGKDLAIYGQMNPPELTSGLDKLTDMWKMRKLFKYMSGKYAKSMQDYTAGMQNRWLAKCLNNLFTPQCPVWFVIMLLAIAADGQMSYLAKGCKDFVRQIEKRYKDLNGEVTYSSTVEKILVRDDCAFGVRLADGTEDYADYVISAGDIHNTVFHLLDGKYIGKKLQNKFDTCELSRPYFVASFGVKWTFENESVFNTLILKQPLQVGNREIRQIFVRIFNYSNHFAPKDKSVIQAEFETEWEYWDNLRQKDPNKYAAEKERLVSEILVNLEILYPGISPLVEIADVATPCTLNRYTLNHQGAPEGWGLTSQNFKEETRRSLEGLSNLYLAGHWVSGGVPGVILSGRQAIQLVCAKEKKPFFTRTT